MAVLTDPTGLKFTCDVTTQLTHSARNSATLKCFNSRTTARIGVPRYLGGVLHAPKVSQDMVPKLYSRLQALGPVFTFGEKLYVQGGYA